ncbi:cell division protein ZapE [Hasllibacter halocynthiae]|uniref:Cell division protein ZapE n=1 Tax=Hasllibacter halocynthiae TaxID=595589 RepID=A0A2T0X341_9RHOB|nr:cell division protein ZapE [Hasllibacter halocynthiae]PRY93358.1 cell division protein ZapE [Hasllibacter halocynthiae]
MTVRTAWEREVAAGRLEPDPAQEAAIPALDRVLSEAEAAPERGGLFRRARPASVRGLYLWGGVGRGKSMLMDLMVAEAAVPVRRVHFHAFMQEVQDALHAERRKGTEDALAPVGDRIAEGLRLLALDEMQVTDIADAMIVGRLFERMLRAGVGVVTTSNRPPRDLYKDGLNRALFLPFVDLIEERLEVLEMAGGADHRQGAIGEEDTWLVPADAAARARIDALFADLAGPDAGPLTLRVKGREVTLPAFGRGAGRAPFWALCGAALGPADYLAVADAVRVMAIDDVPRLGRSNFNEAKRFVTLIDALYEARVRLIASAADEPGALYVEGEGAFEFERTASRLREMTRAGWGGGPAG